MPGLEMARLRVFAGLFFPTFGVACPVIPNAANRLERGRVWIDFNDIERPGRALLAYSAMDFCTATIVSQILIPVMTSCIWWGNG